MGGVFEWSACFQYVGTNREAVKLAVNTCEELSFKGVYTDDKTLLVDSLGVNVRMEMGDWLFLHKDGDYCVIPSKFVKDER